MKWTKLGLAAWVLACALPAAAGDFVSQSDNRPQQLSDKAKVQVVNFWAAWCAPCRKEMPEMSHWYRQKGKAQGVQLVGIAVDSQENVAKFLRTTPVSYPIWRYTGNDSRALLKQYGSKVGGFPHTVVRVPKCAQQQVIVGRLDGAALDNAVSSVLAKCHKK